MTAGEGRITVNVNALRAFAVAAAEGSFSGAARRLGVSQPSISEHIQGLETHFGLLLFERVGREVRLTAAGRRLYEHSARVLASLEDLDRDLRALKEGTGGVLEVVANPIPGEAVLPLLLPGFQKLHPEARVRERIGGSRDVIDQLLRREVELGLVVGPFYDERIEAAFLARDEFALIAPRDHPLATRGPVRLAEVCEYPLVLRRGGSGTHLVVEAALMAAGVARADIKVAAELGNTSAVRRAVEAGLGVAFVSVCTLGEAGPAGDLRVLPLADEPPARDLLVVTERGRTRTALAESFRRYLLATETQRTVATYTRLPLALRHSRPIEPPRVEPGGASPPEPPRPAPSSGENPLYRLVRLPRTSEESLVVRLLGETYRGGRAKLLERLADGLRRQSDDPLAHAPDVGMLRLRLYEDEARALLDRLVGDLLVEVEREASTVQERPTPMDD